MGSDDKMKRTLLRIVVLIGLTITSVEYAVSEPLNIPISSIKKEREVRTCNSEGSKFSVLSFWASLTSYKRIEKLKGGSKTQFVTSDGVKLSGKKISTSDANDAYVLIIQGNGFPAGFLIQHFQEIAELGVDVYAYDFRGYKRSRGKRRFWAMLQDYKEIIADLNSKYDKRMIYSTSFGGVITANIIQEYEKFDQVIFDSVVSTVDNLITCEKNYNPVDRLPKNCQSLTVIMNSDDRFYKQGLLQTLDERARKCGATSIAFKDLAHPFESGKKSINSRMIELKKLIKGRL